MLNIRKFGYSTSFGMERKGGASGQDSKKRGMSVHKKRGVRPSKGETKTKSDFCIRDGSKIRH